MNPLPFDYTVKPNPRRRRMAICVTPAGEVIVRTPPRTSKKSVTLMLQQNIPWVLDAVSRAQSKIDHHWRWEPGGVMPLLGQPVRVGIAEDGRARIENGQILLSGSSPDEWIQSGVAIYRQFAQKYMPAIVERFAPVVGNSPASIAIGGAATSWGCCKKNGVIRFSWRLVCMEPAFIEYVAVHELCHLRHFDHSPAFWGEVAKILPDWKVRKNSPAVANIAAWLISVLPVGGRKGSRND